MDIHAHAQLFTRVLSIMLKHKDILLYKQDAPVDKQVEQMLQIAADPSRIFLLLQPADAVVIGRLLKCIG